MTLRCSFKSRCSRFTSCDTANVDNHTLSNVCEIHHHHVSKHSNSYACQSVEQVFQWSLVCISHAATDSLKHIPSFFCHDRRIHERPTKQKPEHQHCDGNTKHDYQDPQQTSNRHTKLKACQCCDTEHGQRHHTHGDDDKDGCHKPGNEFLLAKIDRLAKRNPFMPAQLDNGNSTDSSSKE